MISSRSAAVLFAALVVSNGGCLLAAETIFTPPTPPTPPPVQPRANPELVELSRLVSELQSQDAAVRDKAESAMVEKGNRAYHMMSALLNNPSPDLAARAKSIREKIEKRASKLTEDAGAMQQKLQGVPLTTAALEELRKAWTLVSTYVPQAEARQMATQQAQVAQATINDVDAANKTLADLDKELAGNPPPVPLRRAAVQLDRAQAFGALQRVDEALKAAQDAGEASGKLGRLTPAALKIQADLFGLKQDAASQERVCKAILADYPESIEARFALVTLADLYSTAKRWDDAIANAKSFINACPVDEEAQETTYTLLDTLSEKIHDYPRAYGLSAWLKGRLPASRVKADILKVLAASSEYVVKDFAQAESTYKLLAEQYNDVVKSADMEGVLNRVRAKAAGKFPKEPSPKDEGPAGALGQFLAAVRARDVKALESVVPAADLKGAMDNLISEESDFIATVTFADYIVKGADIQGDKANLKLDYYDAGSPVPRALVETAVRENGGWKIAWKAPEEVLNPDAKKPAK